MLQITLRAARVNAGMTLKEAAKESLMKSIPAVLTSGGILISAGYIIKIFSTMSAVSTIGELIGRGALISVLLVLLLLPQLLTLFDKLIFKKHLIPRIQQRILRLISKR